MQRGIAVCKQLNLLDPQPTAPAASSGSCISPFGALALTRSSKDFKGLGLLWVPEGLCQKQWARGTQRGVQGSSEAPAVTQPSQRIRQPRSCW